MIRAITKFVCHKNFRAILALLGMLYSACGYHLAIAAEYTFSPESALGNTGNITLRPDGTPTGATGTYRPAEVNMLLGKSAFLTPLECVKRYGINFCSCQTLSTGEQYCYYNRPPEGYYDTIEACEGIWGSGRCVCSAPGRCQLFHPEDEASPLECMGQIYFFSGQKFECRDAGIMTAGKDCCQKPKSTDNACSFENTAKELGLDDIALTSLSIGNKLASLAGYDVTKYLATQVATMVVEEWVKTGSVEGMMASLTSLLGDEGAKQILENLSAELAGKAGEAGIELASQQAVTAVASAISNIITIAGWVYFAYQVYNMIQQLRQCSPGEFTLGCKIAKGVCHKVGNRCKTKVFGSCLQKMEVYCCFDTKLAKIIHEQGRPNIGKGWGSAKKPDCKGLTMDEFVRIDLSRLDFSEYANDLVREMNPNIAGKIQEATKRMQENFDMSNQ